MAITKRIFGTMQDGTPVLCWTLTNEKGLQAEVLDYGVTIRTLVVPDKNGVATDVVLGYDTLEEYVEKDCYLGAVIGRFANRIKGARFELNGQEYTLCANDGSNHLHGGARGFDKYVWSGTQVGESVVFSRRSANMEEGFPGNLDVRVTIGWKGNSLTICYDAQSDRDTILNLTSHSYFNLNGAGTGDIHSHLLQINADRYTLCAPDGVPTGQTPQVAGSAMDFRTPKPIGRDIDCGEDCVKFARGYDANFILSGHPAAIATGDRSGITMITDTDQPGMQLYTANFLGERTGKDGWPYGLRSAFCLETQHYPDSVHHPDWPSCILRAGEHFHSVTSYSFV